MITLAPVTLEGHGVRLEPLSLDHAGDLQTAARDGKLWELWFTSVPSPEQVATYIADAVGGQRAGHMLPWAVREMTSGAVVGSTRYHDISPAVDRVEIGYTWYATRWQRSHVNSACKLLLLTHILFFGETGDEILGEARSRFTGSVQLGTDLSVY